MEAAPAQHPDPEIVYLEFDVNTGDYMAFIRNLRAQLAVHPHQASYRGRPLLAEFRPGYPARWVHVRLVSGNHETTLAIRDDTLYLVGFRPRNGPWYEFGFASCSERLIPGSTFLECGESYGELLGRGGAMNLVRLRLGNWHVRLGKMFAKEAVRVLSGYGGVGGGGENEMGRALAGLIVIVCESARMISHCNTVRTGWQHSTGAMNQRQVGHLLNWGNMSRFLIGWDRKPHSNLGGIGITARSHVLPIVHLVLNPRRPAATAAGHSQSPPPPGSPGGKPHLQPPPGAGPSQYQQLPPSAGDRQQPQEQQSSPPPARRGRPLVEVFSVRANFPVVGTVAVFDGRSGQIIYERPSGDIHIAKDFTDLVLTGPYKAISADGGSFAIKVAPCESESDEYIHVDSDKLWELQCTLDESNSVVQSRITGSLCGAVEMTYGVLSNAVEATVQADLLLSRGTTTGSITHIHGEITTSIPLLHDDRASVLLFNREEEEKLVAPSAGSIHIPLARSVLAMPLGLPLEIKVRLHATTLVHEGTSTATPVQGHLECSFDAHMGEVHTISIEGIGELRFCVNATGGEYKEETPSDDDDQRGIQNKREKKGGDKRNNWMGAAHIRNFLNVCIDHVKSRMF